jgi:hypothetical protein
MKGLQISGYGNPADVVKLVEIPDVGTPGSDDVVIDVAASSLHRSNLLTSTWPRVSTPSNRLCRICLVAKVWVESLQRGVMLNI